jgi:hypothetical protein
MAKKFLLKAKPLGLSTRRSGKTVLPHILFWFRAGSVLIFEFCLNGEKRIT